MLRASTTVFCTARASSGSWMAVCQFCKVHGLLVKKPNFFISVAMMEHTTGTPTASTTRTTRKPKATQRIRPSFTMLA